MLGQWCLGPWASETEVAVIRKSAVSIRQGTQGQATPSCGHWQMASLACPICVLPGLWATTPALHFLLLRS